MGQFSTTVPMSGQAPAGLGANKPPRFLGEVECTSAEYRHSHLDNDKSGNQKIYLTLKVTEVLDAYGNDSPLGMEFDVNLNVPIDESDKSKVAESFLKQSIYAFGTDSREAVAGVKGSIELHNRLWEGKKAFIHFEPGVSGAQGNARFDNATFMKKDDAEAIKAGKRTIRLKNAVQAVSIGGGSAQAGFGASSGGFGSPPPGEGTNNGVNGGNGGFGSSAVDEAADAVLGS